MIEKYGYKAQMTFDITDSEKEAAKKALVCFEKLQNLLSLAVNHLDIMYEPFKDFGNVTPEELIESRFILRNYRDQVLDNFNKAKVIGLKCVMLMDTFASDTQSSEIMNTFVSSMQEIEKQVNRFAEIFNKLSSKEFSNIAITSIDSIKKQVAQLDQLVYDRIFDHIDTNILAKNWVSDLSEELDVDFQTKKPLVMKLWEERKKALEGQLSPGSDT